MADKNKNNYLWIGIAIVVVIVLAIVLISNSNNNSQNEITCNSPYIKVGTECCLDENYNNICDSEEQTVQEENKISPNNLINFAKEIIQNNFIQSKGTYVKSQDIDEAKEKGHGCFTGFSYPCTSYQYPYDDAFSNEVYSHIYDFGEGDSPSLNQILSDQATFSGVGKRSLQNGDIVVQEYDNPNENPYTEEITDYSRLFEADVPCGNRYWIKIGFFQKDNEFSGEIEEKGAILDSANEILGYCNS